MKAQIVEAEAKLRAAVADLPAGVQLNAMFSAYMNLATKFNKRLEAGELLVAVGGEILMQQMLQERRATLSISAHGAAEYHDAPPIVQ